jgi:hypothetical protein
VTAAAVASRSSREALRAEVIAAAVAEIDRAGPDRFRAAVVRTFVDRGLNRATLYRWLDAAEKSGEIGQRVSEAFRQRVQPGADDPSDPTGNIAAANQMLAKLPQIANFGDVTGQEPIRFADALRECIMAARNVMRHARDAEGRVKMPKMLMLGSEQLRRSVETASRILEKVHEIQRVEEFHRIIIEEIRKVDDQTAMRILERMDIISRERGAV